MLSVGDNDYKLKHIGHWVAFRPARLDPATCAIYSLARNSAFELLSPWGISTMKIHRLPALLVLGGLVFLSPANLFAQSKCVPPSIPPFAGNLFSPQQEMDLGEAVAAHIESNFGVIDDEEVTGYLRRIGQKLIGQMPPTGLRFEFFVIDINDVNAFTLPGGRIYVTRKLITFAKTEDELAGVVAHELGHVVARHNTNDLSLALRDLGVTELGDRQDVFERYHLFIENRLRKLKSAEKVTSREDRDQYAADMVGLYIMARAGYDAQAQAGFWDRYHETKGKTGSFFSSLFGTTRPEQKRLGEMFKQLALLPAECKGAPSRESQAQFESWQRVVLKYTGLGRKESVRGVIKKIKLAPTLRSTIYHMRFSPDGKYLLAQDDAGISVLTRSPFAGLFRIHAPNAYAAQFSPDSQRVVFYTQNLRVESWSVATHDLISANEVVLHDSCLQTALSSDGKFMACLKDNASLALIDVEENTQIFEKREFTIPNALEAFLSMFSPSEPIAQDTNFVNMAFSPDAHYFMAGDRSYGYTSLGGYITEKSIGFDLKQRQPIPLKGELKKVVMGGFAFIGSAKVISKLSYANVATVYSFPDATEIEKVTGPSAWRTATQDDYVLLGGSGPAAGAAFDFRLKKFLRPGSNPILDVVENTGATETPNGEIALYPLDGKPPTTLVMPENPLGRLYSVEISPDLRYLTMAGGARGALWNLEQPTMLNYVRGFRGSHFADDRVLLLDFPERDGSDRTIGIADLKTGQLSRGPAVQLKGLKQYGPVMIRAIRPPRDGGEQEDWSKPLSILEAYETATIEKRWSQTYPFEFPSSILPNGLFGTSILLWRGNTKMVAAELKNNANLAARYRKTNDPQYDYLLRVIDLKTGNDLGQLMIPTGGGAFRILDAFAVGDNVVVIDSENRTLIYSLSSGALRGRVFGNRATLAPSANLLCVEDESGQLTFYNLNTFEKRGQLTFADRVRLVRFSADGNRLAVLTANQVVYTFNLAATLANQN
jgi:WD40 repeat protein